MYLKSVNKNTKVLVDKNPGSRFESSAVHGKKCSWNDYLKKLKASEGQTVVCIDYALTKF